MGNMIAIASKEKVKEHPDGLSWPLTPPGCLAVSSETIASASLRSDFFCVLSESSSQRIDSSRELDDDGLDDVAAAVMTVGVGVGVFETLLFSVWYGNDSPVTSCWR